MSEKNRYEHELEISTPGAYDGLPNRFERMLEADLGGLLSVLREGSVLRGRAVDGVVVLQLKNKAGLVLANVKARGIYPGLLAISDCFPAGWDLVFEAYSNTPFTVDQMGAPPTLDDEEDKENPIDQFLKGCPGGTVTLDTDASGLICVRLLEPRPPRKERRGGKVLTYSQVASRKGRSGDLFEALKQSTEAPETIQSNLAMDLAAK